MAAEQGELDSQEEVAVKYHYGIHPDCAKAMEFYLRAADQGSVLALNSLGCMHRDGIGVRKDARKAYMHFVRAHGCSDSQFNLGELYRLGAPGLSQCYTQSLAWFRFAAENGNTKAEFNVGLLYLSGT